MASLPTAPIKRNGQPLRRWDPFERIQEMQREFERFWADAWPAAPRAAAPVSRLSTSWAPRLDIFEKDGNLVIQADLPGLKPEEIEVTLEDGGLLIRGERKAESETKEENYYRMERSYGHFSRVVPLPDGIKPEQIQARFTNGVLEITLPKAVAEAPRAQKISITS